MKNIIGLMLVALGASIFQAGYNMLNSEIKNKLNKELYEKFMKKD
jgi:ascorbate-specific PTS system EIIC-type component UlaA